MSEFICMYIYILCMYSDSFCYNLQAVFIAQLVKNAHMINGMSWVQISVDPFDFIQNINSNVSQLLA